ncbi:hypothetical protein [Aeromicrobium sp.]|uniref:hypothetical protein n=1 Tax=Aeromicrobium sp. TaxID=1871063 RepID=UPI003D6A37E1
MGSDPLVVHFPARYWSLRIGESFVRDVGWSYPDPIRCGPRQSLTVDDHVDAFIEEAEQIPNLGVLGVIAGTLIPICAQVRLT